MHTVIAYKISQDPSLLEKARENLADMRSRHEPNDMPLYIEEWEQILTLRREAYCGAVDCRYRGRHPAQVVLTVYRDTDTGRAA